MGEIITIDMRMINSSGIGTYLKNIVPLIVDKCENDKFILLGNYDELNRFKWVNRGNIEIREFNSQIYSISEQVEFFKKIPKETSLFWSPHYNIPLLYSGKLIVTVHDVFHLAFPQYMNKLQKVYSKIMFGSVNKKANLLLTVSNFSKDELVSRNNTNPNNVRVIYNGVDGFWFNNTQKINLHKKDFILYVGNVKPHKNLSKLIDAVKMTQHEIDIDLVIVGKKEGFITGDNKIIKKAEALKDKVHFTGYIDDELLKQYYADASALVFPSLYEGFGLPPLEAMASGCPVIVSNLASMPEVCGNAAYYINPHDANEIANSITEVLTNKNLQSDLLEKGFKQVRKFNWEDAANKTVSAIREIL